MWVQTAFRCLLIYPVDQNITWNWGQLCLVIGDITKLQQHRKVFVPGTVLETQDFKLVSFLSNNLKLWIFVDLSIQFCPLLLPSITLPTPFTRARPFQGPSNTSSPRNLNTQMIAILTTFNPWSPMVVVVNRYGRPGLWIVKEKQKRKRKEQGPHDLTTTQWPLWQTGRGPNRCRRRTRRGKSDFWELSQITENLRVKSEKCQ